MGDLTWLPDLISSPAQFVVGVLFGWLVYRPFLTQANRRVERSEESAQRLVAAFNDLAGQVRVMVELYSSDTRGTGRHRRDG